MEKCELFVENKNRIDHSFSWSLIQVILPSAQLMTNRNILANEERLKAMEQIVKSKTGAFSDLRGTVLLPLICKMSMAKEPAEYLDHVQTVYKMLNLSKWFGSEYKILAAMTIVDHKADQTIDHVVEKTKLLHQMMQKNHPFLTGENDIPFAAFLAVSGRGAEQLIADAEKVYGLLAKKFPSKDAVQDLSHVLALGSIEIESGCDKVVRISDSLKEQKHAFGMGRELSVLGILACLDMSPELIANQIVEADEYLKKVKGFGSLTIGSEIRRMMAAQMVLLTYGEKSPAANGVVMTTTVATAIAIEAAVMTCMVAATVANSGD